MGYNNEPTWREANPTKQLIGDVTDPHIYANLLWLIAEVIKSGVKNEGYTYFKYPMTKWWFSVANLDYDYLQNRYKRYRDKLKDQKGNGKGKY